MKVLLQFLKDKRRAEMNALVDRLIALSPLELPVCAISARVNRSVSTLMITDILLDLANLLPEFDCK
jgi:hypothetical protein